MSLHDQSIVVDGLVIANWSRAVFEDMRRGGLTAASCTCCIWDNFVETMRNVGQWKRWLADNEDIIRPVYTTDDIRAAKQENRTGIILSFQNGSAFEDQLGYIALFKELGVGIAQLTYNTQNYIGSGCYEANDGGLSGFGREVVAEMNRVGMAIDLSHVGTRTSREAIQASAKPVCYSHCLPAALKAHPRNKSNEELRFIADHDGFVGVTMFSPFMARGADSTLDDYLGAIDCVIDLAGESNVGIGTDFTQGHGASFFNELTRDKGYGRKLTNFPEVVNPAGLKTIGDIRNLTSAMERAGWPARKIENVVGDNWIRFLDRIWKVTR